MFSNIDAHGLGSVGKDKDRREEPAVFRHKDHEDVDTAYPCGLHSTKSAM